MTATCLSCGLKHAWHDPCQREEPVSRPRNAPEKRVQKAIVDAAEALGFVVSSFSQARASKQTPGIPDLFLTHPARRFTCWVEVKAPGKKATLIQRAWHQTAREAGNYVFVCDSVAGFTDDLADNGFDIDKEL